MNKSTKYQKGFAPILVLVIVLTLGIIGFVAMQSFQPKPLVTPTPPANSSRDEVLRDWKTYTNAQFTFNYPSIWFISEEKDKVILYSYDYTKLGDFNPPIDVPEGLDIFQIHISTDNQYADIKSWFEKQKEKISPVTNKTYEFLSVKEVTMGEFQGIYYEGADEWGGGLYANTSFETPNKELVHFSTNLFYKGHEKTYNQILSTFEFTSSDVKNGVPVGYSPSTINVKFKSGANTKNSEMLLTQDLRESLDDITNLYTLSEEELDKLGSGFNLWFKITLKPDVNATDFIKNLRNLNTVESAQFAPLAAPLPQ